MPNATVRAAARTLPKTKRDAAIIERLNRRYNKAGLPELGLKILAGEHAALSSADKRAELNWLKYRQQKDLCHQLREGEEREAAYDLLFDIEHVLQADMRGGSVLALAAVLIIEQEDEGFNEEISGLRLASLAAIRPQLVGVIAEAADRALAEEEGAST